MKKVKRWRKEAPPSFGDGRAKDSAIRDREARRQHRAADGRGQACSREAMTLLQAVQAQDGISVRTGKTHPITFAAVLIDMPFWELEFGKPGGNGPLGTVLSASIVLVGRVIGRTSANAVQMEATLDRLHNYLIPWARDAFEELPEVSLQSHASEEGTN